MVHPGVRVDIARELGQAVLWHRFLITGDEITPELVEHIVDGVLIPYVRPSAWRARSAGVQRAR
jgi:hypothetical protein